MELETINKLYLELSQVATARTRKEIDLATLLRRMCRMARSHIAIESMPSTVMDAEDYLNRECPKPSVLSREEPTE